MITLVAIGLKSGRSPLLRTREAREAQNAPSVCSCVKYEVFITDATGQGHVQEGLHVTEVVQCLQDGQVFLLASQLCFAREIRACHLPLSVPWADRANCALER